jgi:mycothione reductase
VEHFDLAIIGAGSGNTILGPEFDRWRVAIVEEGLFGGTCLNRGCVPTKMLVHVADLADMVRHGGQLGLDARVEAVRWADIRDRIFAHRLDPIAADGEDYRTNRNPNVTVFKTRTRFVGPHLLQVADEQISAERIVVAAGARPVVPHIDGLVETGFFTSDDIMRVETLPEHLVVIGGGFIAAELAHVFEAFGTKVTIVHRGPRLLAAEDDDVSARLTDLVAARFDARLSTTVTRIRRRREDRIDLDLSDGSRMEATALLVATGRVPNTDILHVTAAGLDTAPDGRLVVDETGATNVPGIWALGDISSPYMLKHVANHEARVVAHNLLHPDEPWSVDHRVVPHAVFTRPQVAAVGLTERRAVAEGLDVMVSCKPYSDTAYGWAMEDTDAFVKLVADRTTRRLVGAHVIGPHASVLIQSMVQGMSFGQTVDELARGQYYIHPSLTEVIENALLGF